MKLFILMLTLVVSSFTEATCQLNVTLLHQLVRHSKSEYDLQEEARNRQLRATANEEVNRLEMGNLKEISRKLQSRFQMLGLVLQAAQTGFEAAPLIEDIMAQQQRIVRLAETNPAWIPLALNAERDLVHRTRLLGRYLAGLMICRGAINQMKPSDRKVLFNHALAELRLIAGASRGLAGTIAEATRTSRVAASNSFGDFINRDNSLAADVLRQVKGSMP